MQARNRITDALILVALALVTTTASATFQQTSARLTEGKWTGSAIADGDTTALQFDIAYRGDTLTVSVTPILASSSQVPPRLAGTNVKFSGDSLRFTLQAPDGQSGIAVPCVLLRKTDRSLAGTCAGPQGQVATMSARPPG